MKKYIFIFFIFFTNFTFGSVYTPKNSEEKLYLENLRKTKLKVGLIDECIFNKPANNKDSLNNLVKDLFQNYLNLNVEFISKSTKNLEKDLIIKNIDIISFFHANPNLEKNYFFSDPLLSEDLFIASTKNKINSIKSLDNKKIYTLNISNHIRFLEETFFNNDINAEIIFVKNLEDFKDEIILTANPENFKAQSFIKISNTRDLNFILNKDYEPLLNILNNALNEKYKNSFYETMKNIKLEISLNNFYDSLTTEEKIYLENLKNLNVVYDNKNNSLVSYYSQLDGTSKGFVPLILSYLGYKLNININDLTKEYTFKDTLEALKNKELDVLVLSKTRTRTQSFIFSQPLTNINIYSITLKKKKNSIINNKVGVLKDNIEEEIALRYNLKNKVSSFYTFNSLVKNLNLQKVQEILTINKSFFNPKVYDVILFENIPINLAFDKEDTILRSVIDKGLTYLINKDMILNNANLEKDLEDKVIFDRDRNFNILFLFLVLILFSSIVYIIRELGSAKKEQKLLLKDPLTNLSNRFIFNDFCKNIGDKLIGVAFVIDLNNFKYINDTLGHEYGDSIIIEFSNFLKKFFPNDYLFRISGDEFYCFSFNSLDNILEFFKKYKENCPIMVENSVTYCIGLYEKKSYSSISAAFKFADLAMLDTKKNKTLSYKIADSDFVERKNREIFILNNLKNSTEDIFSVFQPKICLKSNQMIGMEALARYNSCILGYIGPFEFIPIAENNNFIHKIDYKIAEESIKFMAEFLYNNQNNFDNFKISFNLSVKTFKRKDLIEILSNLLYKYSVSGKYFEIEITESIFITDIQELLRKLKALKNLGFTISLDDFTAGHSTAGVLPLLPIDIVKFDKSLLDSLDFNEEKAKIIYINLISLVKELNLKIVAEGVETKEQVDFLRKESVDYAQGYYFSKPMKKEKVLKYINFIFDKENFDDL